MLQFPLRSFDLLLREGKLADDLLELAGPVGEAAIGQHTDKAHSEHSHGNARDRQREQVGRERQCCGRPRRIGDQLHRSHGREMVRDNCQRQKKPGNERLRTIGGAHRNGERGIAEQHAEKDGYEYKVKRPVHMAGHLESEHADIVHAGNSRAHDGAADRRTPSAGIVCGKA